MLRQYVDQPGYVDLHWVRLSILYCIKICSDHTIMKPLLPVLCAMSSGASANPQHIVLPIVLGFL